MKSKYIIIGDGNIPVVFPELYEHRRVAIAMTDEPLSAPGVIVGAGFCYIEDNKYVCYGESISLHIKSRNEIDSKILNIKLGTIDS